MIQKAMTNSWLFWYLPQYLVNPNFKKEISEKIKVNANKSRILAEKHFTKSLKPRISNENYLLFSYI